MIRAVILTALSVEYLFARDHWSDLWEGVHTQEVGSQFDAEELIWAAKMGEVSQNE